MGLPFDLETGKMLKVQAPGKASFFSEVISKCHIPTYNKPKRKKHL